MLVPEFVPLAIDEPPVVVACPLCRLGLEW